MDTKKMLKDLKEKLDNMTDVEFVQFLRSHGIEVIFPKKEEKDERE